jgi:hypothetical protein
MFKFITSNSTSHGGFNESQPHLIICGPSGPHIEHQINLNFSLLPPFFFYPLEIPFLALGIKYGI